MGKIIDGVPERQVGDLDLVNEGRHGPGYINEITPYYAQLGQQAQAEAATRAARGSLLRRVIGRFVSDLGAK